MYFTTPLEDLESLEFKKAWVFSALPSREDKSDTALFRGTSILFLKREEGKEWQISLLRP